MTLRCDPECEANGVADYDIIKATVAIAIGAERGKWESRLEKLRSMQQADARGEEWADGFNEGWRRCYHDAIAIMEGREA